MIDYEYNSEVVPIKTLELTMLGVYGGWVCCCRDGYYAYRDLEKVTRRSCHAITLVTGAFRAY